ncbi:uncharacterized protein [Phaseolus vulgaris]
MQMKKNPPSCRTHWSTAKPGYYRVPSKVVSIPVHFVGSERSRTDSAVKIQRMLRGFLVRNAMRKIGAMRVELERIEREIRVEVLRREQRERVRVIETIMNLLLRLDSVRVLHYSGLRECRKSVIKKAVALQEMLDEMAVGEEEVGEDDCVGKEEEGNGMENLQNEKCGSMEEESIGLERSLVERKEEEEEEDEALKNEEKGDGKKRELLLEKIVEDNQKMMEMMAQLFQRNELQSTLLSSLSQRVEQLERAFVVERLRKKKKNKVDARNKQACAKNGFN